MTENINYKYVVTFNVEGTPIQQGSMRHIGNGRMIHSNHAKVMEWRKLIVASAIKAGCVPRDGAVKLQIIFRIKKPKTIKRDLPTVPPDLDKYIRNVGDALSGVAYLDDGQVVEIQAQKVYSEAQGAEISVFYA